MAFAQSDIDTLNAAIASGALKVRYADGREVTYRSLDEMLKTLKIMQGDVAGPSGTSRSFVAGF
jgi:hypothetical protein